MITSLRSIDTTSPVSSSENSSFQLLSTRAARRFPMFFLRLVLFTLTSSASSNIWSISLSASKPIARKRVVTGNFFLRSIYAYITLLMSVANSIHDPLNGMIRAEYSFDPLACTLCPKNTPGERCNWDTTTRSAPLITKVPLSVIYGIGPRKTSCISVPKSSWSGSVQYSFSLALRGTL